MVLMKKKKRFHADLKNSRFDRIIFNFPHAGFKGKEDDMHMIKYVHYIIMLIGNKRLIKVLNPDLR